MIDKLATVMKTKMEAQTDSQPTDKEGQDGNIYCGICGEPKTMFTQALPMLKLPSARVPIPCKCKRDQAEQEKREREQLYREVNIQRNLEKAFPNERLHSLTFAADNGSNEELIRRVKNYVKEFPKTRNADTQRGLLLYGNSGSGKTFAAACVVHALIEEQNRRCLFTNLRRIENDLYSEPFESRNEYLDDLCGYDLICLDDVGAERDSSSMRAITFTVVDALSSAGTPTIITTNYTAQELKTPKTRDEERLFSRFWELCYPIEVHGDDQRKLNLRVNAGDLREKYERSE